MSPIPGPLYRFAERSEYIDPEHLFALIPAGFVAVAFWGGAGALISVIRGVEHPVIQWWATAALSGTVGAMIIHRLYTTESFGIRVGDELTTKEKALLLILSSSIVVGGAMRIVAEEIAVLLPYPAIQMSALTLLLGFYHIHELVERWKFGNEIPYIVAGIIAFIAPFPSV
jgi:hypothetical protein